MDTEEMVRALLTETTGSTYYDAEENKGKASMNMDSEEFKTLLAKLLLLGCTFDDMGDLVFEETAIMLLHRNSRRAIIYQFYRNIHWVHY